MTTSERRTRKNSGVRINRIGFVFKYFSNLKIALGGFVLQVITIRSTAFWGSVTVIVPPNVLVEQDGAAILGGFGDAGGVWQSTGEGAPAMATAAAGSAAGGTGPIRIKIVGTALMGRVNAVVNHRAKPAQLLSDADVERILREPAEPSTTVSDFVGQALQVSSLKEVLAVSFVCSKGKLGCFSVARH